MRGRLSHGEDVEVVAGEQVTGALIQRWYDFGQQLCSTTQNDRRFGTVVAKKNNSNQTTWTHT